MTTLKSSISDEIHKQLAIELFNFTWNLIEKPDRNEAENEDATQGDTKQRDENIALAKRSAEKVDKESDRVWLLKNVNAVASLSMPIWEGN